MVTKRTRHTWMIAAVVLGGCGLIAMLAIQVFPPRAILASRLGLHIAKLPDDEVFSELHRIGDMDEFGTSVLVDALSSERSSVSDGAGRVLRNQMMRWHLLSPQESTPKVAKLAQHLAGKVDALQPAGSATATDLAEQILLWPIDHSVVDSEQVIAKCEIVLRSAKNRRLAKIADRRGQQPAKFIDVPSLPSRPVIEVDSVDRLHKMKPPEEPGPPNSAQPRLFVQSNELRIERN